MMENREAFIKNAKMIYTNILFKKEGWQREKGMRVCSAVGMLSYITGVVYVIPCTQRNNRTQINFNY